MFGNAVGNAAVAGIQAENAHNEAEQQEQTHSNVDPVAAAELQEEAKREILDGYTVPSNGSVTLPDIQLGTGSNTPGLTRDEQARLATTTLYSGIYVDPYLIAQNGGDPNWAYSVQTFRANQDPALVIAQLQTNYAPPPAEADSYEAAQNTGLRIAGALIGTGRAVVNTGIGAATLAGSLVGTGLDNLLGPSGLGVTNYFHADTEAFQNTIDSTARFLSNHPLDTTVQAWSAALNRAAELSASNNSMDQLESGDILGQLSFNTVTAIDGAAGLGKLGVSGASMLANGAGSLAKALSQVRFAGSADGYVGFAPQIGAAGDLSGFKPNIGDSLDVGNASPVQPLGASISIQADEVTIFKDFVERSVVGDNLDGHEVWQHANIKAQGLATTRLSTPASQNNPVIALDRTLHLQVSMAQRGFNAATQNPIDNINANAEILRSMNAAPESAIARLQQMAIQHAKNYGN